MKLAHKTIQVSSVQLNKTSRAHCPHKASFHPLLAAFAHSTASPPPPPLGLSPPRGLELSMYLSMYLPMYLSMYLSMYLCMYLCICLCICLYIYLSTFLNPFTFFHPASKSPPLWQLSVCPLHPGLLFLLCSLDSTCKWDHMVFVFLWLAYFT